MVRCERMKYQWKESSQCFQMLEIRSLVKKLSHRIPDKHIFGRNRFILNLQLFTRARAFSRESIFFSVKIENKKAIKMMILGGKKRDKQLSRIYQYIKFISVRLNRRQNADHWNSGPIDSSGF